MKEIGRYWGKYEGICSKYLQFYLQVSDEKGWKEKILEVNLTCMDEAEDKEYFKTAHNFNIISYIIVFM